MPRHFSYYINVGQTIGVIGAIFLGYKAIKLEEKKADIYDEPLSEVIANDIERLHSWLNSIFWYYK